MRYVQDYGGYIADVPKIWFKRCDGEVFFFDQLVDARIRPTVKQTEVNAGWSQHPVAYLPSQSEFKQEATSAKFDLKVFAMTNATTFVEVEDYATPVSEELVVDDELTCVLSHKPVDDVHCQLRYSNHYGNMDSTTLSFTIDPGDTRKIRFDSDAISSGDRVTITYFRHNSGYEAKVANNSPTVGEAIIAYPVYGSDRINDDAIVVGHVFIRVYKARIVEHSQLQSDYKTSATHRFVLQAMDAKRNDGTNYTVAYIAKFRASIDALDTKML